MMYSTGVATYYLCFFQSGFWTGFPTTGVGGTIIRFFKPNNIILTVGWLSLEEAAWRRARAQVLGLPEREFQL